MLHVSITCDLCQESRAEEEVVGLTGGPMIQLVRYPPLDCPKHLCRTCIDHILREGPQCSKPSPARSISPA